MFRKAPRKRKIQLGIALLIIAVVAGVLIIYKYFNIFAAGNDITNTATIYYTENGVDKSARSNTVTTTVNGSTNQININLSLQGRTDLATTSTILRVYPAGGVMPVFEKTDISTDSFGNATIIPTGLVEGTTYDFKIKANLYLMNKLSNLAYSNGMNLSFGQLRGGALNGDNIINTSDYQILLTNWFTTNAAADINKDGIVNTADFAWMSINWLKQDQ